MVTVRPNLCLALVVMSALVLCAGCGEPKLDTSSDQAFSASLEKVYNAVPEAEREDFRRSLNSVLENKPIRRAPGYDEIIQLYSLIKAFGGEQEMLGRINGLTRADIVAQGQAILKKNLEESRAKLAAQVAETQKKVDRLKGLQGETEKVEVICTGVELTEGFNYEKKSWGTAGSIAALITVKNNSSETVKQIRGAIVLSDGEPNAASQNNLLTLKPLDMPDDQYQHGSLNIAPGTEWQGKIVWKMAGPDKRHPYPPTKEYTAAISGVQVDLDVELSWGDDLESQETLLKKSQEALQAVEKELAAMQ
ncbi:MAG: hypothetical protein LBV79_04710 [Candidatus Adiutrix sp.]|jgi:hypothetical protein|nr:hypothetical protein [Candidatus Adiutrix sp.]